MILSERELRLRELVDRYVDFVARVLRNAGVPESQLDDDVQLTFMTVARRLDDLRPGAEKNFLLKVALHLAAHARRTAARRREVQAEQAPEVVDMLGTPEHLTGQKRALELLDQVLEQMPDDVRTVFVLYELEELSMSEISSVLGIPRGTVASRLRRARIDFHERVRQLETYTKVKVGS